MIHCFNKDKWFENKRSNHGRGFFGFKSLVKISKHVGCFFIGTSSSIHRTVTLVSCFLNIVLIIYEMFKLTFIDK